MAEKRVSSGVAGLDAAIEGGFPADRAVLVRGEAGTGKSILALQFLMDGIRRGEPGLLVSVDAKPRHVIAEAAAFGWDLQDAVSAKVLAVLDASPYFSASRKSPIEAREVSADLTQQAKSLKATRLVIDSLTSLLPAGDDPAAVRDFLRGLFFSMEDNLGCTVLLTAWPTRDSSTATPREGAAEHLAAGIVDLAFVKKGERFERRLFVRKMRGTPTDLGDRRFDIVSGRGVVLDSRP